MDMGCQVNRRVCGRVRRVARPPPTWGSVAPLRPASRLHQAACPGRKATHARVNSSTAAGRASRLLTPAPHGARRRGLGRPGRTGHAPWGCPAGLPCLAARLRPAGAGARWRTGPVRRPCRSGGERQCRTIPSAPPFRECMGIRFYGRPRRNVGELVAAAACVPLGELLWAGALCCF